MKPSRKISMLTGILFIITFITSIPALLLYSPILNKSDYVLGGGHDNLIFLAAFLELLLVIANIASAIVPFPLLKRQQGEAAIGFIVARTMECTFIVIGILALLSVVTLRRDIGGTGAENAGALIVTERALVAIKDWTFLLGPGFVVGIGNGLLLGYLMYKSRLLPRRLALFGLIGGPLVLASGVAVLFDVIALGSAWQFIATIPEIIWELALGIWLTVRGFSPAPIAEQYDRDFERAAG